MKKLLLFLLMLPFLASANTDCADYLDETDGIEMTTSPKLEAAVDQLRYLFPDLPLAPIDMQRQAIELTDFNPESIQVMITLMKSLKRSEFLELIGHYLPLTPAASEFLPKAFKLAGEDPQLFFHMIEHNDIRLDDLVTIPEAMTRLNN